MGKKKIMGIDPGHGESAAFIYEVNGSIPPEPLSLDRDQNDVIPSAISYTNDDGTADMAIGRAATKRNDVCCYFKTAPGEWIDQTGNPVRINGHTAKDLMRDFVGQLYKQIQILNMNKRLLEDDEIILYVGCPSSVTWIGDMGREQYAKLICEATGLPLDHVHVVEESTAAVFNSFLSKAGDIRPDAGVIVFDFGSSTADCTYIRTGHIKLVNSWTLGASQIERAMLNILLAQAGLSEKDIYEPDISKILLTLRAFKERYYSGVFGKNDVVSICVRLADSDGNLIPVINKRGKGDFAARYLTPQLDMDEFMDDVSGRSSFPVTEKGQEKGEYTWEKGCEAFMEQMRDYIKAKGYPCGSVVLTGGASKMPFVQSIAQRVFDGFETTLTNGQKGELRKDRVYLDNVPSITVARGLCVIGQTDLELPTIKHRLSTEITAAQSAAFAEQVMEYTSGKIADLAFQTVRKELTDIHENITVAQLDKRINQAIHDVISEEAITSILKEGLAHWNEGTKALLIKKISEESEQLYHGLLPKGAISLPALDFENTFDPEFWPTVEGLDLDFHEIGRAVVAECTACFLATVVAVLLMNFPVLGPILVGITYAMIQFVIKNDKNRIIHVNNITHAVSTLDRMRDERIKEIRDELNRKLSAIISPDRYTASFPEIIDSALDIVALRSFRETQG